MAEYEEYESTGKLAEIWHREPDKKNPGACSSCGMTDCVLLVKYFEGGNKCKWCEELEAINLHLRYNGLRRFHNRHRSIRFPDEVVTAIPYISLTFCSVLFVIGVLTGSTGLGPIAAFIGVVGASVHYLKDNF